MLTLAGKTMSELLQDMLLRVSDEVNKRDGSLIRTALSAAAWVIEGIYIELVGVQQQAYGTTATGEYLDMKAEERGVYRLPAVAAVYRIKANLNTLAPGLEFSDSTGYSWTLTSGVISGPDSDGLYTYNATCQYAGLIPTPTGSLQPLSYTAGLTTVEFGDEVIPGSDEENDDSLRERYEESLIEIAFAGNVAAYREKILELTYDVSGSEAVVGALQVFPTTMPDGTARGGYVKIYILDSDLTVASADLVSAVQKEICPMYNGVAVGDGFGFAPIGASVTIATATSTPTLTIDVTILLQGVSLSEVEPEIRANILAYVSEQRKSWGVQVLSRTSVAMIIVREAFIYSAALVTGVADVTNVTLKKNGVTYSGSVSWDTTGATMEWLEMSDVTINIST